MPKGSIEVGHMRHDQAPLLDVYYEPEAAMDGNLIWMISNIDGSELAIPEEFAEEFCDAIMGAAGQIREHFSKGN